MTNRTIDTLFLITFGLFVVTAVMTMCSCGRPEGKHLAAPEVDYVTIYNYTGFQSKTYKAGDTVVCEARGPFMYEDISVTTTASFNMGPPVRSTGRGVVATTAASLGVLSCAMNIQYTGTGGTESDAYVGQSINSLSPESTPD